MCDGSAVSRSTYSALFAIVSTGWGVGDGSTTFNLPDFRGRMPVGIGTHSEVDALGKNDGVAAVADRRVKHKHTVNDPGHTHLLTVRTFSGNSGSILVGGGADSASGTLNTINTNTTGITVGQQTNAPTDGPAFLSVPFIIKT